MKAATQPHRNITANKQSDCQLAASQLPCDADKDNAALTLSKRVTRDTHPASILKKQCYLKFIIII